MKMKVRLSRRAQNDLDQIYNWWSKNRSSEQATKWYDSVLSRLNQLSSNHERCEAAREDDIFPFSAREVHLGLSKKKTHRAVFTIYLNTIFIIRVRHLAQQDLTIDDI